MVGPLFHCPLEPNVNWFHFELLCTASVSIWSHPALPLHPFILHAGPWRAPHPSLHPVGPKFIPSTPGSSLEAPAPQSSLLGLVTG